jgi:predicted transcriptional regulator
MGDDELVFVHVMKHGALTVRALAEDLRLEVGDAERIVARLVARRLLYRHGEDRMGEVLYDWKPARLSNR